MSKFFEPYTVAFVPSRELTQAQITINTDSVEKYGGRVQKNKRDGSLDLKGVTHIISASIDFPQYQEARESMINVSTTAWLLECLMRQKAVSTRPYTPDPNLIFRSVTISCADLPDGDKDAIIGGVMAMGGTDSNSLSKLVTHICALTTDNPKVQLALEKKLKCKIVLPHWFDDCLRLGQRISEDPYLLPDPEILRVDPDARLSIPPSEGVKGASSPRPESLPVTTDLTQKLTVFQKKKLMISEDLKIGSRLRKVLEDIVVDSGGTITTSVYNADMYVCHWRGGRDYAIASRAGKDVGNLSWLYHLITNNQWTHPMKRLLHYPLPKDGIDGFQGLKITLSNYGGDARSYLENLIVACGAEMTKSMKEDNTHVITARKAGEKVDAAAEWNVEIVNHLWIEESYSRCEIQRLSDPRYTHFPPRTNLGEVAGQTSLDLDTLRELYYPSEPTPSPNKPGPLKRPIAEEKPAAIALLEDTTIGREEEGEEDDDDDDDDNPQEPVAPPQKALARPKPKAKPKPKPLPQGITTPLPNRRISAGKENNTPSSTGSRSAKDRALNNLHGMADDIALYEKEKKRKGVIWGGERAANQIDKERSDERHSSPLAKVPVEDFSGEEDNKPKRQKTGLPPVTIRLLITGYEPWVGHSNVEDKDKRKMRELGVLVVQEPKQCSHLAAPKLVRTKKFLCALAHGPTILNSNFIEACGKSSVMPNIETYALKDAENEKKFRVKLKDAVIRAKANNRSLLRHVPIYCTAAIPNGPDTFKAITEANGGIFSIYTGKNAMKKVSPEDDPHGPEPVYLISGVGSTDKKLWAGFRAMATGANTIPRIVTTAWILDVCMAQQLKWDDDEYLIPAARG